VYVLKIFYLEKQYFDGDAGYIFPADLNFKLNLLNLIKF